MVPVQKIKQTLEMTQNKQDFMVGVAARLPQLTERDYSLMQDAGIAWLRFGDFGNQSNF